MPVPLGLAAVSKFIIPLIKYGLGPGAMGYFGGQLASNSSQEEPEPQPMPQSPPQLPVGNPQPQQLSVPIPDQLPPRNTGMNQSVMPPSLPANQSLMPGATPTPSPLQGLGLLPATPPDPSAVNTPVQPIQAPGGQLVVPPGGEGGLSFLDFIRKIVSLVANPIAHLQNFTMDDMDVQRINTARRMKHNQAKALRPELGEYEDLTREQIKRRNITGSGTAYQDSVESYNPVDPKLVELRQKQMALTGKLAGEEEPERPPLHESILKYFPFFREIDPRIGSDDPQLKNPALKRLYLLYKDSLIGIEPKQSIEEIGKLIRDETGEFPAFMRTKKDAGIGGAPSLKISSMLSSLTTNEKIELSRLLFDDPIFRSSQETGGN